MAFFTQNYERQSAAEGQYLRLAPNTTATFRVITQPVEGLQIFDGNNRPHRWRIGEPAPSIVHELNERPKAFAAFGVWHYEDNAPKIYHLTTRGVLLDLANIAEIEGSPFEYDIQVVRKGAGLDTKYYTKVTARGEASPEVKAAADAWAKTLNLDALFTGDNPFNTPPTNETSTKQENSKENGKAAPF